MSMYMINRKTGVGKRIPESEVESRFRSGDWGFSRGQKINVDYGNGEYGGEDAGKFGEVLRSGGAYDTQGHRFIRRQKKEFQGKNLEALTYGMAHGVIGNWADSAAEKIFDLDEAYLANLEKENPYITTLGRGVGFAGSMVAGGGYMKGASALGKGVKGISRLTPGGMSAFSGRLVERGAAKAFGLEASEEALKAMGTLKLATATGTAAYAGGFVEEGVFEVHNVIHDKLLGDPQEVSESVISRVGLAALLGGVMGGGLTVGVSGLGKVVGTIYDNTGKPLSEAGIQAWGKWLSRKGLEGDAQNAKDIAEVLSDPKLMNDVQNVGKAQAKAAKETKAFLEDISRDGQALINLSNRGRKARELKDNVNSEAATDALRESEQMIVRIEEFVRRHTEAEGYSPEVLANIQQRADELKRKVSQIWKLQKGEAFRGTRLEWGEGGWYTVAEGAVGPRELPEGAGKILGDLKSRGEALDQSLKDLEEDRSWAELSSESTFEEIGRLESEIKDLLDEEDLLKKRKANTKEERADKELRLKNVRDTISYLKDDLRLKEVELDRIGKLQQDIAFEKESLVRSHMELAPEIKRVSELAERYARGEQSEAEFMNLVKEINSGKVVSNDFVTDLYFKMDTIKQDFSRLRDKAKSATVTGEMEANETWEAFFEETYEAAGGLRDILESPIWGDIGAVQKEWNEAVSEFMSIRELASDAVKRGKDPKTFKVAPEDFDEGLEGFNEFIEDISGSDVDGMSPVLDQYTKSVEKLIAAAEKYFSQEAMAEVGAKLSKKSFKAREVRLRQSLEDLRRLINTREMLKDQFPEARKILDSVKATGRATGAAGWAGGFLSTGAVAGMEGAAQLASSIVSPLHGVRRLAGLANAKNSLQESIHKIAASTARGMVSKTKKAGGKRVDLTGKGPKTRGAGEDFLRGGKFRGSINLLKSIGIKEHMQEKKVERTIKNDAEIILRTIDEFTGNPAAFDAKLNESLEYLDGAEDAQESLRQAAYSMVYYLKNNQPIGVSRGLDPMTGETTYSISDYGARGIVETFAIISDPVVAMKAFANNTLTKNGAKVFRDNYPSTFAQFKKEVFEKVHGAKISNSDKIRLSSLFGEALTPMANPNMVTLLQQNFIPPPEPGKRPSRAKLGAIGERAKQMMTPSQEALAT